MNCPTIALLCTVFRSKIVSTLIYAVAMTLYDTTTYSPTVPSSFQPLDFAFCSLLYDDVILLPLTTKILCTLILWGYFMDCHFHRFVFLNLWFLAVVLSYPLYVNILWMKPVQVAADLQSCERKTPRQLKCIQYFMGGPDSYVGNSQV